MRELDIIYTIRRHSPCTINTQTKGTWWPSFFPSTTTVLSTRSQYKGTRRRLVLAFDVGTTYSGISYSVLDPGQVPEIKGVTRYPGNELVSGASKIPTIIYYDQGGNVRAVGAEATDEGIFEVAENEKWVKAEWFKLHLRSKISVGNLKNIMEQIPPLPLNKTVLEVFADFLRYLLECASTYIRDTHANGPALWNSVKDDIEFVLSHPNGWEGREQAQMREAAVLAGLIPDTLAGHSRVSFVTEGEASLHFAIQNSVLSASIKKGEGIVIVDAGGGTIDVSSYSKVAINSYEEIAPPQCHFHGSVFVTMYAQEFLKGFLAESAYLNDLDHIMRCFDKTTKLRFRNTEVPQYIKFGSPRDNDTQCDIRVGQLKLAGSDVAQFFAPSVECIVSAVLDQLKNPHSKIGNVVLVGGFAASDWLFNSVLEPLENLGLNVLRPDNHVNKAVSDGAVSFYLDHFVRSRVSRAAYGIFCGLPFNDTDPEHLARYEYRYTTPSGSIKISNFFQIILPKNIQVLETTEFRRSFSQDITQRSQLVGQSFTIWCYRGTNPNPKWKEVDAGNYTQLCNAFADLSHLYLPPRLGLSGNSYYRVHFDIILQFGLTKMKAQIAWRDNNGVEKRGPARMIYEVTA